VIAGEISGLYVFPSRSVGELKEIYGDIVQPHSIVKCDVDRIDLSVLGRVTIGSHALGYLNHYIIMNMDVHYEEGYSTLELLRKE